MKWCPRVLGTDVHKPVIIVNISPTLPLFIEPVRAEVVRSCVSFIVCLGVSIEIPVFQISTANPRKTFPILFKLGKLYTGTAV